MLAHWAQPLLHLLLDPSHVLNNTGRVTWYVYGCNLYLYLYFYLYFFLYLILPMFSKLQAGSPDMYMAAICICIWVTWESISVDKQTNKQTTKNKQLQNQNPWSSHVLNHTRRVTLEFTSVDRQTNNRQKLTNKQTSSPCSQSLGPGQLRCLWSVFMLTDKQTNKQM